MVWIDDCSDLASPISSTTRSTTKPPDLVAFLPPSPKGFELHATEHCSKPPYAQDGCGVVPPTADSKLRRLKPVVTYGVGSNVSRKGQTRRSVGPASRSNFAT